MRTPIPNGKVVRAPNCDTTGEIRGKRYSPPKISARVLGC